MIGHRTFIVAALAALLLGFTATQTYAQAKSATIGVVDVEKVFNELDERADILAGVQSEVQKLQQWEQQQRESLKKLQMDLDLLKPDTQEYINTREQLRRKAIEIRVELEVKQRQLEAEQAAKMEMLYRKILDGIARVAQEQNVQLVLMKDNTPAIRNANAQQIAAMVQGRKVLYSAPDMDMSEAVKRKLNAEYKLAPKG
jgi:Skp family chaperone for outer membrane proteins